MQALSSQEVQDRLAALKGWQFSSGELEKWFLFSDFMNALEFVGRVGALAEQAGHHPDIDIRYNRVRLGLVTHDAGGLTAKDFSLAETVDRTYGR